ncbi:MAG: hypothetical protein ABI091_12875, partial [Ferruginibacter sp.]
MKLKIYIFLFLIGFFAFAGTAQTRIIDSLKQEADMAVTPMQRADALLILCGEKNSLNADSLFKFASEVKSFYSQPSNPKYFMVEYYLTWCLLNKGKEDSVIIIADKYMELLKKDKANSKAYMLFFQLKAFACYRINRPKETIKVSYELAAEALKRKDTLSLL